MRPATISQELGTFHCPLQVRKTQAGADTSSGSLPDTSKLLPRLTPSRSLARSSPMSSSMKARINSFSSSLAAQG